ncbi:MAG: acyl-CoA mutase large subunit family protein [Bacteroidetes bacterium]|nr:acyl-CoA mutase large subunit family protein [Bacteroidota bacterium]
MGEQKKKLFSEFPPVSTSDWEAMIKKDLKGADYEKKLVWNTREGFNVKPYYRDEDLQGIDAAATLPGAFPFVRGNKVKGNDWYIRQNIRVNKVEAANKKALDILMKGVNSLGFVLDDNKEYSKEDLDGLCRNIFAEIVELNFVCGRQAENIAGLYLDLVQQYNRDFRKVHGSVNFDPLGRLVIKGNYYDSFDEDFERCRRLINLTTNLPNFSVITVNGRNFHHAGSSIVQELAFSLAAGAEYLTQLSERGLSVDKVATGMRFNFSIGPDYFMEMARIRAARQLWANIVKAYGPSSDDIARMSIHSETASWNITVYDPYVNMLRTTTESMSAAIAGVDSHIVRPFDGAFSKPDEFSERIARNQQLLLKEEVYLDKVADPAAGSYYIESLTDQMVQEAWKIFLEIEEKGGYIEAVKSGYIQQKVRENAEAMDKAIATRKMSLLGTNQYPDFTERIEKYIPAEVFKPSVFTEKDAIVETLTPYRGSQAFEVLRKKTDDYSRENKRPAVFMFTYGNLTMRIARAQFAGNFFAVAGFDLIDNPGFKTIDDGVQAAIESKAGIVVICSSDDEYASIAPEIYKKLKDHAIVMLAGYPKDIIEDLKQAGMKHFIHMHSNVLESLQEIQQELGI